MKKTGFTFVELLVIMAIISTLSIGFARMSFNVIGDKQALEKFVNEVSSEIERVRTNTLVGKSVLVGSELVVPKSWKISIPFVGNDIVTNYNNGDDWAQDSKIIKREGYSVEEITCTGPNNNEIKGTDPSHSSNNTGTIIFEKDKYYFDDLCGTDNYSFSKIAIEFSFRGNSETLEFDTINGLIKRSKN